MRPVSADTEAIIQTDNRIFVRILWGIGLGVAVGLFFGEAIHPLSFVSNGFIRLLQVNVLPYLLGSLIVSLGSRGSAEMKAIARYGIGLLLLVWGLSLLLVLLCPLALPRFGGAPVFGVTEAPHSIDWLDLYIPANLFHALSNNLIPAVVLFGILAGVALGQMRDERKAPLLHVMTAFNEAMSRVSRIILHLTPFGLFAIAAVTAGEIQLADLLRLQLWLHFYAGGALLLTLWVLPTLVARFTPVPARRMMQAMRSAVVTAAAAGDSVVVLPLIAESAKELLVERGAPEAEADRAVSVAVPLLFNFPHAGKILSLAFLPFAAWFSGSALNWQQFGLLITAGPMSLFGNINAAIPFLLDLLRLPADSFEFFTMSSVVNSHLGAMTAAAHTAALSVVIAAAMVGLFRMTIVRLARFVVASMVVFAVFVVGTRAFYTWVLPPMPSGLETLAPFELRPPLVPSAVVSAPAASAVPAPGSRLQVIRERGVLRVGYIADAVPWAFMNATGQLVGYDIEAAHRLASQVSVRLEFIEVPREAAAAALTDGRIDILMSGFVATVARAERMELSDSYGREHVGFLVRDFARQRFGSTESLQAGEGLTVAVPTVEGAADFVGQLMPQASRREFHKVEEVIRDPNVTAVLMQLERAHYWSRVHPEFAAVRPIEVKAATLTVYALPYGEFDLRNLVNIWIQTRQVSGEAEEAYGTGSAAAHSVPARPDGV